MGSLDKRQLYITQADQSTSSKFDEWELIDTDLNDQTTLEDEDNFLSVTRQYKFVIGISKPQEVRIGLNSISKSKITIKGRLGIQTKFPISQ
ncbi:unnamed protein product [Paramecium pentaurelia]|uniref:Uncharacterized protein n=1 Tax=Paramecium pentaurelia TaxID=43138 RepID=A0A8S1WF47_9CILI|nr:unnamed protein product [Paramecium pentaurelia]